MSMRHLTDKELYDRALGGTEKQLLYEIKHLLIKQNAFLAEQVELLHNLTHPQADKNALESQCESLDYDNMTRGDLFDAVRDYNGGTGPKGYTRWKNEDLIAFLKGEKTE